MAPQLFDNMTTRWHHYLLSLKTQENQQRNIKYLKFSTKVTFFKYSNTFQSTNHNDS